MFTKIKIFTFVYFISFNLCLMRCARILAVFPTPSISHQIVFRPLVQELAKRGHEVTVITTDPMYPKQQAPNNLTEIDVHDLSYTMWTDILLKKKVGSESDNLRSQYELIFESLSKFFEAQINTDKVQDLINKKKGQFDLLIIEAFVKQTLIFTHIFKVPTIQISSFGGFPYNYQIVGAPTHPLLYPTIINKKSYNLSYYEKLQQLYERWMIERSLNLIEDEYDKVLKNMFGQDIPTIRDLSNNVDMLFLNIHPIWSDNQPVPPNVVYIRGIHSNSPTKLPKDLETLLNESKNGIIYFSLGTNVKSAVLPLKKIQIMVKVFSELPYDVIWKWDFDSMPGKSENIKLYKWLPQPDLLRHPKVKLFITQGGLQSTDEAIDAGVPVIGIPMLADQWYNAEKYSHYKVGLKLDMSSLTEEIFREAIKTVISDKSYRENMKKLRTVMKDDPQTPLERAVWWTEYVLRHGGAKHLRAAGANITWAQYLELELVAILVLVMISALIFFFFISYYLIGFVRQDVLPNIKRKML